MKDDKRFIYKSTVKDTYGLTDSMIKRLGDPDKTVPNPYYRSGPPASLYAIDRVERWIEAHQEEVDRAIARRAKRSQAAKQAAETRARRLIEWAEASDIIIDDFPTGAKLRRQILDEWLEFRRWERNDPLAWEGEFTMSHNAVVAHIRHNYTNYHELLQQIAGEVGTAKAYVIIRQRVDEAISKALEAD